MIFVFKVFYEAFFLIILPFFYFYTFKLSLLLFTLSIMLIDNKSIPVFKRDRIIKDTLLSFCNLIKKLY